MPINLIGMEFETYRSPVMSAEEGFASSDSLSKYPNLLNKLSAKYGTPLLSTLLRILLPFCCRIGLHFQSIFPIENKSFCYRNQSVCNGPPDLWSCTLVPQQHIKGEWSFSCMQSWHHLPKLPGLGLNGVAIPCRTLGERRVHRGLLSISAWSH